MILTYIFNFKTENNQLLIGKLYSKMIWDHVISNTCIWKWQWLISKIKRGSLKKTFLELVTTLKMKMNKNLSLTLLLPCHDLFIITDHKSHVTDKAANVTDKPAKHLQYLAAPTSSDI